MIKKYIYIRVEVTEETANAFVWKHSHENYFNGSSINFYHTFIEAYNETSALSIGYDKSQDEKPDNQDYLYNHYVVELK